MRRSTVQSLPLQQEFPALSIYCLQIYGYAAEWLTELELNRTQTEFDDSLSLKIYLLQASML